MDRLRLMWIIIYYYHPGWITADYYRSWCDSLTHIKVIIYEIYLLRDNIEPQLGRGLRTRDTYLDLQKTFSAKLYAAVRVPLHCFITTKKFRQ
jgi:hypothetical protein